MLAAGIVTYNPNIARLSENINAIIGQVDKVLLFDNNSNNFESIESLLGDRVIVLDNSFRRNIGVAAALNALCGYAYEHGYEWILTLDQDSICPNNMISEYSNYMSDDMLGILTPRIYDRSIGEIDNVDQNPYVDLDACITSASLVNLKIWKTIGGFWNELFVDMVDFDYCWTLKNNGYHIIRVNSVSLLHELGHSDAHLFRGQKVAVFNHDPARYYYIIRNTIAVGKKHHRNYQCFRWNLKRIYLVFRYEDNRVEKLKVILRGIIDGLSNHLGAFK